MSYRGGGSEYFRTTETTTGLHGVEGKFFNVLPDFHLTGGPGIESVNQMVGMNGHAAGKTGLQSGLKAAPAGSPQMQIMPRSEPSQ
jgi:hypothetical protein